MHCLPPFIDQWKIEALDDLVGIFTWLAFGKTNYTSVVSIFEDRNAFVDLFSTILAEHLQVRLIDELPRIDLTTMLSWESWGSWSLGRLVSKGTNSL